jgi:thiosulfate dehydrogenase
MKRIGSLLFAFITLVVATAAGLGIGYLLWGEQPNWYAVDVTGLGQGPQADLIRYGRDLITDTSRYIGKSATNPSMRYAGNDLACQNCHFERRAPALRSAIRVHLCDFPDAGGRPGTHADRPHQRLHATEPERQGSAAGQP